MTLSGDAEVPSPASVRSCATDAKTSVVEVLAFVILPLESIVMIGILWSDPTMPGLTPVFFKSMLILPEEVIGELVIVKSFAETIPTLVTLPDPDVATAKSAATTCPKLFIVNIGMLVEEPYIPGATPMSFSFNGLRAVPSPSKELS